LLSTSWQGPQALLRRLGIALSALGEQYCQLAAKTGISLEAFHRVASLASGGLDTLPHNGAVLTLLAVTGMTHREAYRDIFVTTVLLPILSSIPAIILASVGVLLGRRRFIARM